MMDLTMLLSLLQLILPFAIIMVAMIIGTILEKNHYKSIHKREDLLLKLPAIPTKTYAQNKKIIRCEMVTGSVVVSIDYFKRFLAKFRNIFGGRIRSYETLLDRGRREAVLRMKESFPEADVIVNFRMETSTIGKQNRRGRQSTACIEIIAYGTAIKYGESAPE